MWRSSSSCGCEMHTFLVASLGAEISDDCVRAGVQLDEVAALLRSHTVQREVVDALQTGDQLSEISKSDRMYKTVRTGS